MSLRCLSPRCKYLGQRCGFAACTLAWVNDPQSKRFISVLVAPISCLARRGGLDHAVLLR